MLNKTQQQGRSRSARFRTEQTALVFIGKGWEAARVCARDAPAAPMQAAQSISICNPRLFSRQQTSGSFISQENTSAVCWVCKFALAGKLMEALRFTGGDWASGPTCCGERQFYDNYTLSRISFHDNIKLRAGLLLLKFTQRMINEFNWQEAFCHQFQLNYFQQSSINLFKI